jgi:adenylate cyclase
MVRLRYRYRDIERNFEKVLDAIVIGRANPNAEIDLDLTPDAKASRVHARITDEHGNYWIEDLQSRYGTKVDGEQIKGKGKIPLFPGQLINISETELILEVDHDTEQPTERSIANVNAVSDGRTLIDSRVADSKLHDSEIIDASSISLDDPTEVDPARAQVMARLYQLPLLRDEPAGLDGQMQQLIEVLVETISSARRGAILLKNSGPNAPLLLKGHLPPGQPAVSYHLVNRAISHREAFMWNRSSDLSDSIIANSMQAGMYAPLVWRGEVLGVICIDNNVGGTGTAFVADDLRLLIAAAEHATATAVRIRLEDELRQKTTVLNRLMKSFAPRNRARLLERASHGRLQGGERSDVAILESDIRGFTKLTAGMDADDVVELLNDYLPALSEAIAKFDGTIDKFVGDAILAVFFETSDGKSQRHQNAVRAAFAMQEAMEQVTVRRKLREQTVCRIGVGVHSGEVLHCFIGSHDERMELTVIGEPVNMASRYCAGCEPGEILISPAVYEYTFNLIEAERTTIESKHEGPLSAYRLRGLRQGAGS